MEKIKIKIGILALCAVALSYMAMTPVLASIGAEFSGVSETLVQMIITLPSLLFIVGSPLSGIAMSSVNKKKIAMFALTCYLVGGLFPFFFNSNIWQLLAGSAIIGVGTGFLMPLINGFIVQYFDKENQAGMMGLNATFTALGAMAFIFAAGQLAKFGWRTSYIVFAFVLVIIIVAFICLPAGEPVQAKEFANTNQKSTSKFEMNPYIMGLFIIGFIYYVMQNAFNTNSSAYVSEVLGAGAAVASIVTMANTIGGIIGGATFKGVSMKFKNQVETITLVIVAVGFLVAFLIQTLPTIIIGSLLVGYGFALFNAGGTFLLAQNTRPETNAFTVSVYLALINIGAAISPVIVNTCGGLIGNGTGPKYLLAAIIIAAVTIYSFILNRAKK
ncbi:MAG: MFS transporter [Pseudobutyrivibrio sp.]|nr:MFS transporter [Pseudobutyrivibrio sp.]